MARIGYARVSTDDQDLTLQRRALREAGAIGTWRHRIGPEEDR